ncbi:hypothetical protein [Pandoraea sp. ISTKB]|uniref:hypothetical protein n=1 Tax=Pandoraea sp. ISTKB TaxID=1586708 RepID=UPI0008479974|nr:hypothetical protein [Pandoraea sp. ISTKB]ODP31250.1 hypothetical protein A9762_07505 [Pandoraea sp. ISTKB]
MRALLPLSRYSRAKSKRMAYCCSIKGALVPGARPSAYLPSLRHAETELDLRVSIPLETVIRRTMQWHRARTHLTNPI